MTPFLWILFLVVCIVVWTRGKKEPFEQKKLKEFFEFADPYIVDVKKLYVGLKNTNATLGASRLE
jgi:hypothetical protein